MIVRNIDLSQVAGHHKVYIIEYQAVENIFKTLLNIDLFFGMFYIGSVHEKCVIKFLRDRFKLLHEILKQIFFQFMGLNTTC